MFCAVVEWSTLCVVIGACSVFIAVSKLDLGGSCVRSEECRDEFAVCDRGTCVCHAQFFNQNDRCGTHTHVHTHRVLARVHVYKYSLCDRCAAADWTTLRASMNYFGTFDIPFASFPEKNERDYSVIRYGIFTYIQKLTGASA